MYDEQLEKLIEMALMDGELTEKEKQILFKKAESFGVDLDEFEMVLDAKLFEKQQSLKQPAESITSAPKSNKFGDVKKCPACGAIVQSFQTKCSDCGQEFSNIDANTSIQKLFKLLNDAEDTRANDDTSNPLLALGKTYSKMFQSALGGDKIHRKKVEIISSFPIPNTKEDILEFLSLALPKTKSKFFGSTKEQSEIAKTWKQKCEQIIMKARFSLKEDKKILDEINNYAKEIGVK